ncbi:MAG: tetratricopeptide repeat protein [bacterium]|nr:tetratricopeptide repeat protein [bacterium]
MISFLPKLKTYILYGLVFLLPLFFLPITPDFFDLPKLALLSIGVLLLLFLWTLEHYRSESWHIRRTPFDLPILAFVGALVLSSLLSSSKLGAFVFPGTTTLITGASLLYFLLVQEIGVSQEKRAKIISMLLLSASISAFVSVLAGLGLFELVGKNSFPAFLTQPTFGTIGGALPAISFWVLLIPLAVEQFLEKKTKLVSLPSFVLLLLVLGVLVVGFYLLPGQAASPKILPLSTGWAIALETLKTQPFFGVGPGNFLEAFGRFRPVSYNFTDVWNLRFAVSSNWYLHVWTTSGLLGVAAFLWLVVRVAKTVRKKKEWANYSLLLACLTFLLIPGSLILIVAFYILLALLGSLEAKEGNIHFPAFGGSGKRLFSVGLPLLSLAALAALLWFGGKIYVAETVYYQAISAAGRNEVTEAYKTFIKAIQQNPGRDVYRITYSQTNIAIANSLAGKKDLTDQDKQTINQLVQQAIREGKAAVVLNPRISANWENLARIYQALIPLAQGADQWAISSYQQAINLDPVNPILRIAFGGVFYSLQQYDDAIRTFELAVSAKPDFANAHYNLAAALKGAGATQKAIAEMEQVLKLVKEDSPDYQLAQSELNALRGQLAQKEATPSGKLSELTPPEATPSAKLEPKLNLPQEATPPATTPEASPQP